MSKKELSTSSALESVRVDMVTHKPQHKKKPLEDNARRVQGVQRNSDFAYVNSAYVGSMNSVNETRISEPPTGVYREQYWACSKWPYGQRILAISVGLLLGTVIGLAVTMVLRAASDDNTISGIFRNSAPD